MSIPVFRSYIKRKDMDTVLSCLMTDSIGPGAYLERFQKQARDVFGFEYGFAVRSPYYALELALGILGLSAGDAVAISALSPVYYSTLLQGKSLIPVYVDVALSDGLPDSQAFLKVMENLLQKPKAVIFGGGAGILPSAEVMSEFGLPLIEDFTRCLGGTRGGMSAKATGNLAIMGFEQGSMISSGGGALLYAQGKREAAVLKNLAESLPPENLMTDYNAALGLAQLRNLDRTIEKRREIRLLYSQALAGGRHRGLVQTGEAEAGCWSFPVVIESSTKDAIAYSRKKDVETLPAFADSCMEAGLVPEGQCPNARALGMRTLLFPLHQRVGAAGVQKISRVLATLP